MLEKPLDKITWADIEALRTNKVPEGRTIEYKRELPSGSYEDRREFLADVSSFANTAGGDLLYGIVEEGGLPTEIVGIAATDIDQEVQRLDSLILSGLDPRLRHEVKPYKNDSGTVVLLLRVEQSWMAPHRVVLGGHDKFYARTSAGKYALDVAELGQAFLRGAKAVEQIRRFQQERLVEIARGRMPCKLGDGGKLVVQSIPLEAFTTDRRVEVAAYDKLPKLRPPTTAAGYSARMTLNGVLVYASGRHGECFSYTELYRNGIVESVDPNACEVRDDRKIIRGPVIEQLVFRCVESHLAVHASLGVMPPVYVCISLVGMMGHSLVSGDIMFDHFNVQVPIDRELVQLPEVVIGEFPPNLDAALRYPIDTIWNACGAPGSPFFDEKGAWRLHGQ